VAQVPQSHTPITIDRQPYKLADPNITGAALRQTAKPPIGEERSLWRAIAGPGDDEEIGDTAAIVAKPGDRFFSVPRTINPGSGQ
jgi:hypothetical protein